MQKIVGTTIKVNRGDVLNLSLSTELEDGTTYTFHNGDKIVFSIYEKGKMSDSAVVMKEINVLEETETVDIGLTSEETKIGDLINKPITYWYEVELNDQYTIIGYDENGAKEFMLYPEGSKISE